MDSVSNDPRESARKSTALVLRRIQRNTSQQAIATAIGVSDATISRLLSEQLDRFMLVLAHAGIKCVPSEYRCYPEDEIQALITLARRQMKQIETPASLIWDDE